MPIFIDNRGSGEADLAKLLKEMHLAVEVRHIDSGDIVFGDVGIERKTVSDLTNSISGEYRHFWEQLDVLKRTYKYPLVIIEGPINYKDKWLSGVLASIAIGWKIPYINSFNLEDSAWMIKNFYMKYGPARASRMYCPKAVKKAYTPEDIRWMMLQCIPRIGPATSKRILEKIEFKDLPYTNPEYLAENIKGLNKRSKELLIQVFKG